MTMLQPVHPGLASLFTETAQSLLHTQPTATPAQSEQWQRQARAAGLDGQLVAACANQWQLRAQGETKLGDWAKHLWLTRVGLEQATRRVVAEYHARIWQAFFEQTGSLNRRDRADDQPPDRPAMVTDLGCGLGVDSYALARTGIAVTAIEIDRDTAALAAANLSGFKNAKVVQADAHQFLDKLSASPTPQAFYADPARREGQKRIFDPQQWTPSLSRLLAAAHRPDDAYAIKLAPGLDYRYLPEQVQTNWVSVDGQLVEACLWSKNLISAGGCGTKIRGARWATIIDCSGQAHHYDLPEVKHASQPSPIVAAAKQLEEYLWEPDPAIIRAGGIANLSEKTSAKPVSQNLAYLTATTRPNPDLARFVTTYRVIEVLPLKPKPVKKYLQTVGATRLDIKKRGVKVRPEDWRKQVLPNQKNSGALTPKTVTLTLTRVGGQHRCLILEPVG